MKENIIFKDSLTDEFDINLAWSIIDNLTKHAADGFGIWHQLSRDLHSQEKTNLIPLINEGVYGNEYKLLFVKSFRHGGYKYCCCKINNNNQYSILLIIPRHEIIMVFEKRYEGALTDSVHYCIASEKCLQDFIDEIDFSQSK